MANSSILILLGALLMYLAYSDKLDDSILILFPNAITRKGTEV